MLTGEERFNQLSAARPQTPPVMAAIIAKITREARERKVGQTETQLVNIMYNVLIYFNQSEKGARTTHCRHSEERLCSTEVS